MEQMLNSIGTCQRLPLTTNCNGTGAQNALTVAPRGNSQTQLGGGICKEEI